MSRSDIECDGQFSYTYPNEERLNGANCSTFYVQAVIKPDVVVVGSTPPHIPANGIPSYGRNRDTLVNGSFISSNQEGATRLRGRSTNP